MRETLKYQSIKENPKTVRDINAKCPTTGVRLQLTVQLHFPITAFQNDLRKTKQLMDLSYLRKL